MDKKTKSCELNFLSLGLDCACVIHGSLYQWEYVDKLYNMLCRHLTPKVRLHVFTENTRIVPEPYIKHTLEDWTSRGLRKGWWYKMQLFNLKQFKHPLLYFDLDTVIVNNIDWIWQTCSLRYFWAIRDFKSLYQPSFLGMNSSVMWWDPGLHNSIWNTFKNQDVKDIQRKYHGDQDYLTAVIAPANVRYFNTDYVKSWRWQAYNGGYEFLKRCWKEPSLGTQIDEKTSILVFHGNPKPDQITDSVIAKHWR